MDMDKSPTDGSKLVEIISNLAKKLTARQQHELINHIKIILKGDDKRDSERKAVNVSVDYSVKDRFYSDMLDNISAGGAFIRTARLFQTGHSTTMVLSLPEMDRNIKVNGEIVRQTGDGFGVRFTDENKEMLSDIYNQFGHSQA
jgi:Tfp pilus assembly protein PilZ